MWSYLEMMAERLFAIFLGPYTISYATGSFDSGSTFLTQDGEGVKLDGLHALDYLGGPLNVGCWRQPSTCVEGFSITMWLKIHSFPTNHLDGEGILTSLPDDSGEGFSIFLLKWNTDQILKFEVPVTSQGESYDREVQVNPPLNTWTHYMMAYKLNDTSDPAYQITAFINGQLVQGWTGGDTAPVNSVVADKIVVGRRLVNSDADYADCSLSSVMIFDGVLSANTVSDLYGIY